MLKRLFFVLLTAALASPSALAADEPTPVGLGPYVLGMSIEEAKSVPIDGHMENEVYRLACSDEKDIYAGISKEETAEGVIGCRAGYTVRDKFLSRFDRFERGAMYFGDIILEPTFFFHDGRLYKIELRPSMNWRQQFVDALELKYGQPTKADISEASNAYGATWPKVTSTWNFGPYEIKVDAPGYLRDQMEVVYRNKPLTEAIDAKVRARKASAAGI